MAWAMLAESSTRDDECLPPPTQPRELLSRVMTDLGRAIADVAIPPREVLDRVLGTLGLACAARPDLIVLPPLMRYIPLCSVVAAATRHAAPAPSITPRSNPPSSETRTSVSSKRPRLESLSSSGSATHTSPRRAPTTQKRSHVEVSPSPDPDLPQLATREDLQVIGRAKRACRSRVVQSPPAQQTSVMASPFESLPSRSGRSLPESVVPWQRHVLEEQQAEAISVAILETVAPPPPFRPPPSPVPSSLGRDLTTRAAIEALEAAQPWSVLAERQPRPVIFYANPRFAELATRHEWFLAGWADVLW